jgi:hypothetical protein
MPEGSSSDAPMIKPGPRRFKKTVVYLACGRFISFSCHRFPRWLLYSKEAARRGGFWLATFGSYSYFAPFRRGAAAREGFCAPSTLASDRRRPWRIARRETSRPLCALTCIGSYSAKDRRNGRSGLEVMLQSFKVCRGKLDRRWHPGHRHQSTCDLVQQLVRVLFLSQRF